MANFDKEFEKLLKKEGGYANDPDDKGGETYMGISRVANPKWTGWHIIDSMKEQYGTKNLTSILSKNKYLTGSVKLYYKNNYWDCFDLDRVPNDRVAHELFDTCVNMGKKTAVELAQQAAGLPITGEWDLKVAVKVMNM